MLYDPRVDLNIFFITFPPHLDKSFSSHWREFYKFIQNKFRLKIIEAKRLNHIQFVKDF
jgi:hypothetical protein